MTEEVQRNYLEINSIQDLNKVIDPEGDYSLDLLDPINFQLNKFFYKNIKELVVIFILQQKVQ